MPIRLANDGRNDVEPQGDIQQFKMYVKSTKQRVDKELIGQLFTELILWFTALTAVQPVLGPLHLALADHAHRYNTESGLYEDIINPDVEASVPHTACSSSDSLFADTYSSNFKTTYTICPSANLIHLRGKATPFSGTVRFVSNTRQSVSLMETQTIHGTPIYLTAPKQSPPLL